MSEEAHLNGFHTLDISQETPWAWGKPVKADGGGHSKINVDMIMFVNLDPMPTS